MNKEQEAEAALPPGVARGRSLNTPSEALQERAGGVGPGGQIGPDPNTLADPRTPVPTTAKDEAVDDLNEG